MFLRFLPTCVVRIFTKFYQNMPKYNISVNKQGTITWRTLRTSTMSYLFTFNLARKCLKRRKL